jgi:hypothetical protein
MNSVNNLDILLIKNYIDAIETIYYFYNIFI